MGGLRPANNPYQSDKKAIAEVYARISQETFDQAVQENVDEFGMDAEEALADAIEQFETQGVNLSNVVKRVPGAPAEDDPPAIVAVRTLKDALAAAGESDEAEDEVLEEKFGTGMLKLTFFKCDAEMAVRVTEAAAALRTECQRDKEQITLVVHNGAVDALVAGCLSLISIAAALPPVLESLAVVLGDAEAREQLGVRGICALMATLRRHENNTAVLTAGLHAVRAGMLVHETQRQQFVGSAGLLKLVAHVLRTQQSEPPCFLAACGALRASTLSDDLRARTSKGLEHAKAAVELQVLEPLLAAAQQESFSKNANVMAELLATLSRLAVTDQICAKLASMDALSLAVTELGKHMTDAGVAKQACFFLASISGNDQCKGSIVAGNGHIAIIQAMLLHPNNASMQSDAVSALGNMCLRMPTNCEAIAEAGGMQVIVSAFTQHLGYARMQSKAPLAIRNMVGRNQDLIKAFLDLGVEQPLREVLGIHPDGYVHNLAKAALRELHLNVHLAEAFQGTLETAHTLEMGDPDGENHWDKFLETPVAQEAIKREMEAHGVSPVD